MQPHDFDGTSDDCRFYDETEGLCGRPRIAPEMHPQFKVNNRVIFTDEFGKEKESIVTRIVPVGEYAEKELGYAIRGSYGDYVRGASDIRLAAGGS